MREVSINDVRPVNGYALVKLLKRPVREGSLFTPGMVHRAEALIGENNAPGLRAIGRVVTTDGKFEAERPGLVGKYVIVAPDGGRGAFDGHRGVFYRSDEVLAVLEGVAGRRGPQRGLTLAEGVK